MPAALSYPGVYIEEVPSGVRSVAGVSTSDTAFVDFFARGPLNEARRITGLGDFERLYGGLDARSEGSYAVQQYFLNGGGVAYVVRVASGATAADRTLGSGPYGASPVLRVAAANPGAWGNSLEVAIDARTRDAATQFNLAVQEVRVVNGRRQILASETYRNLEMSAASARYAPDVVNRTSTLVRLFTTDPDGNALTGTGVPGPTGADVIGAAQADEFLPLGTAGGTAGFDGLEPSSDAWRNTAGSAAIRGSEAVRTGLFALENIAPRIFNLLCTPSAASLNAASHAAVVTAAAAYCRRKRAFLLVDVPPEVSTLALMDAWMATNDGLRDTNAAVYFPRLQIADPLNENRPRDVSPSGTMAGIYARTDVARGVWKAPAGIDAVLRGADVGVKMNDLENGALNPLGVNALRTFPIYGPIVWGARTMEGADQIASEWKYVPVRRTALFIEESLSQGLKWVVFEPNDEPLWAQIRQNVGSFLQGLFRQGAFQGATPREAYFVRCGRDTTTATDQDLGIVNIVVGFAPLKPAEFVVVKIQQIVGQAA
ncbi:MAG: putative tail sheath protein [Armatimonadetes bacterium]|jgi:phage tail sheath protein FI|nr:putative tail sheath protein [Armatimonadota bacterium]